jgi:DNA-binding transcriptional regulator YdaS (Cro superfamily)
MIDPDKTRLLLRDAIEKMGSQEKLAEAVGRSQAAVSLALTRGRVSAGMAFAIERATQGSVASAELRPDVFGSVPERAQ